MQDRASINCDICIALDDTCLLNGLSFRHLTGVFCTETAAIDVAIDSATLSFCSDGAAVKHDISVTGYTSQLTTAIDRFLDGNHMTFDIVTNRDVRISCNHGCQTETTAKDIFINSTVDDVHGRIIGSALCWCISSLIATAIYAIVHSTAIDIDRYCILRSTQDIVTTKDFVNNSIRCTTLFQCHGNGTIDVCSMIILCSHVVFTQTSSVDITGNGAAIEVNVCCLTLRSGFYAFFQMRIHLTLGTAAIDVTGDVCITFVII